MSKIRIATLFLNLLLLAQIVCAGTAHALTVTQMRIGVHPEKNRLVLDLSAPSNFRTFLLADPYRIVIDLPDFTWQGGQVPANSGSGLTRVRYGSLGQGFGRMVFDLAKPMAIKSAFTLPRDSGASDRLVIDFAPASDAAFRADVGHSYGGLQMPGGGMPAPAQTLNAQLQNLNDTRTAAAAGAAPLPDCPPAGAPPKKPANGHKPVIVIDPGHGGPDVGATGINGVYEKNVTLALAKELKKQLEAGGQYKVILTRDDDIFIPLRDRVSFARLRGAELFVSIHADSIDKPGVRGASIYTLSDKASDEQSARLAAQENKADMIAGIDLSDKDEDVANILVDLTMRDTMNQSRFFSGRLNSALSGNGVNTLERPQRSAGFAVLKAPDIPSVLIETGFMSNSRDARMLSTPAYRATLAGAIRRGIDAYFEQVRKNQRT